MGVNVNASRRRREMGVNVNASRGRREWRRASRRSSLAGDRLIRGSSSAPVPEVPPRRQTQGLGRPRGWGRPRRQTQGLGAAADPGAGRGSAQQDLVLVDLVDLVDLLDLLALALALARMGGIGEISAGSRLELGQIGVAVGPTAGVLGRGRRRVAVWNKGGEADAEAARLFESAQATCQPRAALCEARLSSRDVQAGGRGRAWKAVGGDGLGLVGGLPRLVSNGHALEEPHSIPNLGLSRHAEHSPHSGLAHPSQLPQRRVRLPGMLKGRRRTPVAAAVRGGR